MMDEEQPAEFDFNGKSNEEVLSGFFYEIRASVASVVGYLELLKLLDLPEENRTREFVESALKRAQFVYSRVGEVFQYLDEQRTDQ